MDDDKQGGWKQFQKLSFDSKKLSRRVKKAEGATVRHARKFIVTRLDNIRQVRRRIIGWLLFVGALIVAVGAQFVWFQQSYKTTAAAPGGTYAEASLGPIDTLNPLYASSNAEISASRLLFSSLYTYDSTGHLHTDLAESTKVDDSGKIYRVTLRSDATWHDGRQLTARDVEFTVNLIKNPEVRSSLRINWQDVKVKAVDDMTVQFTLPAAYAAFPHALTFAVVPEHVLEEVAPGALRESSFSRSPIGSGPFSLRLFQIVNTEAERKTVHATAYEKYYGGQPLLNRFEVHAYSTREDIMRALQTGEVSAAADLSVTDVPQVDTHNYNVATKPVDSGVYALLNNDSPILEDKRVRLALRYATNTEEIRKDLPVDVPSLDLPFISGQLTGKDVPVVPAPSEKRAASLLDEAGWRQKDGIRQKDGKKLALTITTTKNSQYERTLETLVGQWRRLGIQVDTNVVDTADPATNFVQNILQPRNYDVLLYELFIGADPDVYAYWHSSQTTSRGYNFANYVSGAADDALSSARSRSEADLRNAKYLVFARQWVADAPAIGLYQRVMIYASNTHVRAMDPTSKLVSPYDRFSNVLDWSVNERSVYKTP